MVHLSIDGLCYYYLLRPLVITHVVCGPWSIIGTLKWEDLLLQMPWQKTFGH